MIPRLPCFTDGREGKRGDGGEWEGGRRRVGSTSMRWKCDRKGAREREAREGNSF